METIKKYRIEGIDCANCAADIERALQRHPGLEQARINLATQTLGINPGYLDTARSVIASMEPQVRVSDRREPSRSPAELGKTAGMSEGTANPSRGGEQVRNAGTSEGAGGPSSAARRGLLGVVSGLPTSLRRVFEDRELLRLAAGGLFFLGGIILGSVTSGAVSMALRGSLLGLFGLQAGPGLGWLQGFTGIQALFTAAFIITGWPVVWSALRNLARGAVFDETLLMTIATLGAAAIGELAESAGVMIFYGVGEWLQDRAVNRSRQSISALVDLRPDTLRLVVPGGETRTIPASEAEPDQVIEHWPGERIGVDGILESAQGSFDTSALTGESVPRTIRRGEEVAAGFLVTDSPVRLRVTRRVEDSAVSRILNLVEDATDKKAKTERFIARFARIYTPLVVAAALVVALVPPLAFGGDLNQWVYRALTILVISCPCALVISIPLGYFAGLGAASRRGVLVKGAEYLDRLARLSGLAFDKTGTLTKGVFEVRRVRVSEGFSADGVIRMAAEAEAMSSHPIARAILSYAEGRGVSPGSREEQERTEHRGMGITLKEQDRSIAVGNGRLMEDLGIQVPQDGLGGTVVYVALDGRYAGVLEIDDEVKPGTWDHIQDLKRAGVSRMTMVTGDREEPAVRMARDLGITGVRHSLLPEDKVSVLEGFMQEDRGTSGFIGDGINDAPVLARADVGIAMGGLGSDAAIEAADVVLMSDSLGALGDGIRIGRQTRRIILQNIIFALGFKAIIMIFGILGEATMWQAVIADVGVALVAVLNSIRILRGTRS